ncbi:MAG TPA: hypothetical protein DCY13_23875, partial [Verrucomicrobiales bacterium]|nr:hypothetical protein [Verrucomicrobiales bacterium]
PGPDPRVPAPPPETGDLFVHILYDGHCMQDAAAALCERLRAFFDEDIHFHIMWSHFQQLTDPQYGREAAEVAAQADVVVIATASTAVLPAPIARWLGMWICHPQKPDGLMCGLFGNAAFDRAGGSPVAAALGATARLMQREWMLGVVVDPVTEKRPSETARGM